MPRLRQTFLAAIRTLGNHSGCHQLPERSFFYKGKQFPVCARCTGVLTGQVLALFMGFFFTLPVHLGVAFLSVMGIDWGIQALGLKLSTNPRRLVTGILGGFGLFSVYITLFKKLMSKLSA